MPTTSMPKRSVLIVEDEVSLLTALTEALEMEGFQAFGAKDGQAGLGVAKRQHPDLIILDLIMPNMSGMEMLRELRTDPWGKTVPVIILTNRTDYRDVAESLEHQVYDFLVKANWSIDDVIKKVREKLGDKAPGNSTAA